MQTTGTILCILCSEVLQIAASSFPVLLEALKRSEGHIKADTDACKEMGGRGGGSCAVSALSSFRLQCASFHKRHDHIFEGCEGRSTSEIMLETDGVDPVQSLIRGPSDCSRVSFSVLLESLK